MKFFADTASLEEIAYCFSRGVADGITTNPKIMESSGDLSRGFKEACKSILDQYPAVHVSLETDLRGIPVSDLGSKILEVRGTLLDQAYQIAGWGNGNVVVKIPISEGGLEATRELSRKGIKTNVTACMTPYQALKAAEAGATYVSLFANRMLDVHILELAGAGVNTILQGNGWKDVVKANKQQYEEEAWRITLGEIAYVASELENSQSELIVGSIRSPKDIYRLASARPQVITIPTGIVKGLEGIEELKRTPRLVKSDNVNIGAETLDHPMTSYTLEEFERAADSYRNK